MEFACLSASLKSWTPAAMPLYTSIQPWKWKQPPPLRWKYRISRPTMLRSYQIPVTLLFADACLVNLKDIWSTAMNNLYTSAIPSHVPRSQCLGAIKCCLWCGGVPSHLPSPGHMVDQPCPQGVGRLVLFTPTLFPPPLLPSRHSPGPKA